MYGSGQGVVKDNVRAHMWFSFAALSGGEDATINKEKIAKRMNPSQIKEASELAKECYQKKFKDC